MPHWRQNPRIVAFVQNLARAQCRGFEVPRPDDTMWNQILILMEDGIEQIVKTSFRILLHESVALRLDESVDIENRRAGFHSQCGPAIPNKVGPCRAI